MLQGRRKLFYGGGTFFKISHLTISSAELNLFSYSSSDFLRTSNRALSFMLGHKLTIPALNNVA